MTAAAVRAWLAGRAPARWALLNEGEFAADVRRLEASALGDDVAPFLEDALTRALARDAKRLALYREFLTRPVRLLVPVG